MTSVAIINPNYVWMDTSCTTEEMPKTIYDKELEVLIFVSIERLKKVNLARIKYSYYCKIWLKEASLEKFSIKLYAL